MYMWNQKSTRDVNSVMTCRNGVCVVVNEDRY